MIRILILSALSISSCSKLQTKDACIANAPGLETSPLSNSGLADETVVLSFYGSLRQEISSLGDYLLAEGIRASFFFDGNSIANFESTAGSLFNQGFIFGSHGFSGRALTSLAQPITELHLADAVLHPYVTNNIYLLFPPEGTIDDRIVQSADQDGFGKYVGPISFDHSLDFMQTCLASSSVEECATAIVDQAAGDGSGHIGLSVDTDNILSIDTAVVEEASSRSLSFEPITAIESIRVAIARRGGQPDLNQKVSNCNDYD